MLSNCSIRHLFFYSKLYPGRCFTEQIETCLVKEVGPAREKETRARILNHKVTLEGTARLLSRCFMELEMFVAKWSATQTFILPPTTSLDLDKGLSHDPWELYGNLDSSELVQ